MSERYGTPGELKEHFQELEGWLEEELLKAREKMLAPALSPGEAIYQAARRESLRDVLDFILVNPGG